MRKVRPGHPGAHWLPLEPVFTVCVLTVQAMLKGYGQDTVKI